DRNNPFFPNCRDDRVSFSSRTRNASGQNEYRKSKKMLRLAPSVDFSSRNPGGLVRRASGIPKLRVLVRLKKSARNGTVWRSENSRVAFEMLRSTLPIPSARRTLRPTLPNRSPGAQVKVVPMRVHGARGLKSELPPA